MALHDSGVVASLVPRPFWEGETARQLPTVYNCISHSSSEVHVILLSHFSRDNRYVLPRS